MQVLELRLTYKLVYKEHPRSKFEMFTWKISPRTMEKKNNRIKEEADELFQRSAENNTTESVLLSHLQ